MTVTNTKSFSARRSSTALVLTLAALVGASAPAIAQEGGSGGSSAPTDPSAGLQPIAADGFRMFMELMDQFAKDQIARLPSADKSARENAYGQLAAMQLAGAGSALVLPGAGLALGGGIGLIVDASTGGLDAGAGTLAGGSIGLGSGMVVGLGAFVTSLLATLPMVDEIESKYPAEDGAAGGNSKAQGGNFILQGGTFVPPAIGTFESFYVNLVATLPDQFVTVVEQWDRTPGLGNAEKNWLRSINFARPHLQRLAWIKRNLRVSPNAPRANDMFLDVGRVLSGDSAAMERAWLAALGLGATGLELKNDKLSLTVPAPLQALGVPARLQANVPDLKVKVGGNGGALDPYLRIALEAGPFDVDWGTVDVVKSGANRDLVSVTWSVAKGARLGSARISFKAGGDETKVLDLHPTLDRKLQGTLFFKLQGMNLQFEKAQLGNLELRFGIPKEIRDMPVVKDLMNGLLADFERDARNFLRDTVPFARLFDGFGQGAAKSLAAGVQRDAGSNGLARIDSVTRTEVSGGVLKVHVRGKVLQQPAMGNATAEIAAAWKRFAGKQKPVLRPTRPVVRRPVGGR
ncbi:MAG: hypothetical protein H6838_19270 [Planctomycetes bacterium]|nr:hypothetical protein [Planctomycetota bacterium]MCB9887641.1 hypothetical protein [Planctomycetota bacterium]